MILSVLLLYKWSYLTSAFSFHIPCITLISWKLLKSNSLFHISLPIPYSKNHNNPRETSIHKIGSYVYQSHWIYLSGQLFIIEDFEYRAYFSKSNSSPTTQSRIYSNTLQSKNDPSPGMRRSRQCPTHEKMSGARYQLSSWTFLV